MGPAKDWNIPLCLAKTSDIEKTDAFLAPMKNSKASKLPEAIQQAREKAAAKKKQKKTKEPKKKSKQANEKDDENSKRKSNEAVDTEQFNLEMTDHDGRVRLTLFGDDLLNAVNYTLERVSPKNHRKDYILQALNLGVLFCLEGSLDKANLPKYTAWSRVRQYIKSCLNRAHALQPRLSDPDKPLGVGQSEKEQQFAHETEAEEGDCDGDGSPDFKMLAEILKSLSEKSFSAFMEGNFPDYSTNPDGSDGEDQDGDDEDEADQLEPPKLADVLDSQPGIKLTVNKLRKTVRGTLSALRSPVRTMSSCSSSWCRLSRQ